MVIGDWWCFALPRPRTRYCGTADPTGTAEGYRQISTGGNSIDAIYKCCPEWRGHSCLRTYTRADRNVCPTIPRSIAAASRDGVAPPVLARLCRCVPGTRRQAKTADEKRQRVTSDRQTPSSMTICRPFRASRFWPVTQGVALGWYIAPFQGCHQLCREPVPTAYCHCPAGAVGPTEP